MRIYALAVAAAAFLFFIPDLASAQSFEIGPGGVRVYEEGFVEAVVSVRSCGGPAKTKID